MDADNNLYGTTIFGGGDSNLGTVFQVTPSGDFAVLHRFTGADGKAPQAGLIEYAGDFFGTTTNGGDRDAGVVFKVTPSGDFTVLHSFTGGDGANPAAGLVADPDNGTLYGTAAFGGDSGNGTVFRLTQSGDFQVLHSFTGADGAVPRAGLIGSSDAGLPPHPDNGLYGTTSAGGSSGHGTVFWLDRDLQLTVLHSFSNGADGGMPLAGLTFDPAESNFYGTTNQGGDLSRCGGFGCGTVFQLPIPVSIAGISRKAR